MSRKITYFRPESSLFKSFQIRSEPQNRVFSSKIVAFQKRSETQIRAFSSKIVAFQKRKWAAKSRSFVQNRRFSKKKCAAKLRLTSYLKSDDFVDIQIRNEKLQNHNKEMGYRRTHARTDARTDKYDFSSQRIKKPRASRGASSRHHFRISRFLKKCKQQFLHLKVRRHVLNLNFTQKKHIFAICWPTSREVCWNIA